MARAIERRNDGSNSSHTPTPHTKPTRIDAILLPLPSDAICPPSEPSYTLRTTVNAAQTASPDLPNSELPSTISSPIHLHPRPHVTHASEYVSRRGKRLWNCRKVSLNGQDTSFLCYYVANYVSYLQIAADMMAIPPTNTTHAYKTIANRCGNSPSAFQRKISAIRDLRKPTNHRQHSAQECAESADPNTSRCTKQRPQHKATTHSKDSAVLRREEGADAYTTIHKVGKR